jgi:hypothetical protein
MPLSNSPDPAVREAVVQRDLGNVLHPIVQHKTLETKQMVVTGGEGSTPKKIGAEPVCGSIRNGAKPPANSRPKRGWR